MTIGTVCKVMSTNHSKQQHLIGQNVTILFFNESRNFYLVKECSIGFYINELLPVEVLESPLYKALNEET